MKLQLKRSSLADSSSQGANITASGAAKVPSEAQMKFGELAINYSELKNRTENILPGTTNYLGLLSKRGTKA